MTPETKAAMERLAGMTWTLIDYGELIVIGRKPDDKPCALGLLFTSEADKLGLTPGMTIAIYPVGMDEEEKTDD